MSEKGPFPSVWRKKGEEGTKGKEKKIKFMIYLAKNTEIQVNRGNHIEQ